MHCMKSYTCSERKGSMKKANITEKYVTKKIGKTFASFNDIVPKIVEVMADSFTK